MLDGDFDTGSSLINLTKFITLANSVILEAYKGARLYALDIKDFPLASPMTKPCYMCISADLILEDIMIQYKLNDKIMDGYV